MRSSARSCIPALDSVFNTTFREGQFPQSTDLEIGQFNRPAVFLPANISARDCWKDLRADNCDIVILAELVNAKVPGYQIHSHMLLRWYMD